MIKVEVECGNLCNNYNQVSQHQHYVKFNDKQKPIINTTASNTVLPVISGTLLEMSDKKEETLIVVGISGVTCGGKTTTADKLRAFLPNCEVITQDDYFWNNDDPRHKLIPELNHVNYDILSSLDMEKLYKDVLNILNNDKVVRINHNYKKITDPSDFHNICNEIKSAKLKILIIEGFSIFNYEPLVPLFDLKYYFTLTKEECVQRRALREYDPPDVPGYFEICAWPEHLSQLDEVRTKVDDVNYYSGMNDSDEVTKIIIRDIFCLYRSM